MLNKNTIGEMLENFYNRRRESDIIVNYENKEITFRDFLKMDFKTETITFTEQELEIAILYNSKIKIEEITKAFKITKEDFKNIFDSLKRKITSPKYCSKKYIANRMCKIFPKEICYRVLEKYNFKEISIKRHGISPENKYDKTVYEEIKENISQKVVYNSYSPKQKEILSTLLEEIIGVISSKIPPKQLSEIINNIENKNNIVKID